MAPKLAERLYRLGFRDVNGRDHAEMTPLAAIRLLDTPNGEFELALSAVEGVDAGLAYAAWLVSKEPGALRCVQRPVSCDVQATAAHHFACRIGENLSARRPQLHDLESSQDLDFQVSRWFWTDMIRLETFNALGLTHVCCYGRIDEQGCFHRRIDRREVQEIRSEETVLIDRMEDLIREFEYELANSNSSITEFFEGYWKRRMSEVLSHHDEPVLQAENLARLRELGVILDADENSLP
ncbi:MAG: hypothetical protein M1822_007689 [Bathelium mastoideum]|nr:MAG: hypothetical protein M1822_007689 [Bathelium mastoideum]